MSIATSTPSMDEEDGAVMRLRYRSIADVLNELDEHHHHRPASPSRRAVGGGGRGAGRPASKEAIEALKDVVVAVVVAGDVDDQPLPEYCAICLDHGTAGAGWKETPCVHRFHGECLERWLRVHGTCPMCRRPVTVPPPPPAEEEDDADRPTAT